MCGARVAGHKQPRVSLAFCLAVSLSSLLTDTPTHAPPPTHSAATLLLRGANDYMLDEMDRSLHDSLCTVKVRGRVE